MTNQKGDRIWKEWFTMTETTPPPARIRWQRSTKGALPVGMAAAAIVIVAALVVGSRVLMGGSLGGPGASPTTTTSPSATQSAPSQTARSSAPETSAQVSAGFATAGVLAPWHGFAWSAASADDSFVGADPGVIVRSWSGGYFASGTTGGGSQGVVWTSADGTTWQKVSSLNAPEVLVASGPKGLLAVTADPSQPTSAAEVWVSSDGANWSAQGQSTNLAVPDSLAGTNTGFVLVEHTVSGSGKFATATTTVASSSDGIRWSPVTVQSGLDWSGDVSPVVVSANGRFFMLWHTGGADASGKGLTGMIWWSDDGLSWARSAGTISQAPMSVDVAANGLLVHTSTLTVGGGGVGLLTTRDGGKSWVADPKFGPLGAAPCKGVQCATAPSGAIGSNGALMLAMGSSGQAWTSSDGLTWTSVSWGGPLPSAGPTIVLPRGVLIGSEYGAAR
jgi:hypothetical protein